MAPCLSANSAHPFAAASSSAFAYELLKLAASARQRSAFCWNCAAFKKRKFDFTQTPLRIRGCPMMTHIKIGDSASQSSDVLSAVDSFEI
jgi:hypothetical protein